jgi:hypothetical protein
LLDARTRRQQKLRNTVQTLLVLGCLVLVSAGVAWLLGPHPARLHGGDLDPQGVGAQAPTRFPPFRDIL